MCTLSFIEWLTKSEIRNRLSIIFVTSILEESVARLNIIRLEMIRTKNPPLPNTINHRHQIRLWQSMCCLTSDIHFLSQIVSLNLSCLDTLWDLFDSVSLPDIRHLMELFFCRLSVGLPSFCIPNLIKGLTAFNTPIQQISSFIVVTGCLLLLSTTENPDINPISIPTTILSSQQVDDLITALLPLSSSNSALARATVHSLFVDLFVPDTR